MSDTRHAAPFEASFDVLIVGAHWDRVTARWHVEAEHAGRRVSLSARFLYMCSGYYDYDEAYRPHFDGEDTFSGRIVHPRFWPAGLDYRGRRVVVAGSGAKAVTLVPTLAQDAAHVTILQRSPTYIVNRPSAWTTALRHRRRAARAGRHAGTVPRAQGRHAMKAIDT
jgi:cation diffusion facilitator CzcD-associated flavoprotein CzcO